MTSALYYLPGMSNALRRGQAVRDTATGRTGHVIGLHNRAQLYVWSDGAVSSWIAAQTIPLTDAGAQDIPLDECDIHMSNLGTVQGA